MPGRIGLADVAVQGCAKPRCRWNRAPLHRHHKAHQALWFGPWARRHAESKWRKFVERYHEFRTKDICVLCSYHHAEIHSKYDEIIADDVAKLGLPLYRYSWKQGEILMKRLTNTCNEWLSEETPGIDSKAYGSTRKLRWSILQKEAKRRYPNPPSKKKKPRKRRRKRRR